MKTTTNVCLHCDMVGFTMDDWSRICVWTLRVQPFQAWTTARYLKMMYDDSEDYYDYRRWWQWCLTIDINSSSWWHQAWMLAWELLYSQQKRKPSGGDEKSGEFSQMVQVLNSSSSFSWFCQMCIIRYTTIAFNWSPFLISLFIYLNHCLLHAGTRTGCPKELGSRNYNGH